MAGGACLSAFVGGLADYVFRFPSPLRMGALAVFLALFSLALLRFVWPVLRLRVRTTDVGLRVERHLGGPLAGLLTSGVEFSRATGGGELEGDLRRGIMERAAREYSEAKASRVLRTAPALQGVAVALLAAAAVAGSAAISPRLTAIGAQRVLTPWSQVTWPKRTEVASATITEAARLGDSIPIRAIVTKSDQAPASTRVSLRYRVIAGDDASPIRRAELAWQGEQISRSAGEGQLYELLIDPDVPAGHQGEPPVLRFWLETSDDSTPSQDVTLYEAPRLVSASAEVTPPEYIDSGLVLSASARAIARGISELGLGGDQRCIVDSILRGSSVEISLGLSAPVSSPEPGRNLSGVVEQLAAQGIRPEIAEDKGSGWRLRFTPTATTKLRVSLRDEHGIEAFEEPVFVFNVVEDEAPSSTVVEPAADESVIRTARVGLRGEGRDDLALAWTALRYERATMPAGSVGAPPEPSGNAETLAMARATPGAPENTLTAAHELDLSSLGVEPGDELLVTVAAADIFTSGGVAREPVVSQARRLRIISEEQFVEQVRADLASIRSGARRVDEQQRAAMTRSAENEGERDAQEQAAISSRLELLTRALRSQADRIARNQLGDGELERLVDRASELSESAERASRQAEQGLASSDEQASEGARRAQSEVRDRIGEMVEALDRGEDAWLARRNLDRLIEDQRDVMERTSEAARNTMGRNAESLTPGERAALDELAREQRELADRTEDVARQMEEQGERMGERDPAQSEALQDAADRAREQRVSEQQQQASRSIQENMSQSASEQQQSALESLEDMRQDVENAQRNRDANLRRQLADVMQRLRALITRQEEQVAALDGAIATGEFGGLDAGMIGLHTSTIELVERVRASMSEMASVADATDQAGAAQSDAIRSLRAKPVDEQSAHDQEHESLRLLRYALSEAGRLDEEAAQREQDRLRQEVTRAYREMLDAQQSLLRDTEPLAGQEMTRRQRAVVRRLGDRQGRIGAMLSDLRATSPELDDSPIIALSHDQLARSIAHASSSLDEGEVHASTVRHQRTAERIIERLIASVDPRQSGEENEFREASGGAQAGGQSGQQGQQEEQKLIEDIAQLRLLKFMQEEAYAMTRMHQDEPEPDASLLDDASVLQREIAERAQKMIEQLTGPPAPAGGGQP